MYFWQNATNFSSIIINLIKQPVCNEAYRLLAFYNKYLGCVYQRVADLFYEGIGTAQDDAEAFRYYQLAEECYYTQIADGDKYHADQIPVVIERQKKLRKRIQKKLPKYEF